MATHSSVLAWRIPGTGEPGGLLSMGLHRGGHDWSDLAAAAADPCTLAHFCRCLSSAPHSFTGTLTAKVFETTGILLLYSSSPLLSHLVVGVQATNPSALLCSLGSRSLDSLWKFLWGFIIFSGWHCPGTVLGSVLLLWLGHPQLCHWRDPEPWEVGTSLSTFHSDGSCHLLNPYYVLMAYTWSVLSASFWQAWGWTSNWSMITVTGLRGELSCTKKKSFTGLFTFIWAFLH